MQRLDWDGKRGVLFKALDDNCEHIGKGAGNAAALSHAQVVAEPVLHSREGQSGLAGRFTDRIRRFEEWCAHVDLAPDLASDIGSRKWLRGFATLLGLSVAAIALWPDFSEVEAATAMPVASRERDEFRSQSIAPLALGGDSGRHMGASPLVHPLAQVPERPLVGNAVPVSDIASGTQFDITLGKRSAPNAPRELDALDFRARFDLDLSIERGAEGGLALVRHPIAVDATPLRIRGTVGSSLYRSARNAGAPVAAIQSYLRAVDKYINLESGISASDEYDMIVAYKRSAKGEHEVGDLLYAGIERDGKPRLQLLRWGKDGQMFAASSIGKPRSVPIGQPVAGHITSRYGMRRHPILGYVRMHAGIDFGAAYGSPIYAVADGKVTYAGRHGGHGNYVRIQHAGGLGTGYGHMSRIAVANGAHVRAGQVIGYVGSTGLSTGPHLHFEAYRNGHTINPAGLSIMAKPQIAGKERDAFKAELRSLLTVEPGAALAPMVQPEAEHAEAEREIDRLAPQTIG
ncbi:MAG: M23 family metallopeptidase [Novosphingobium sp.]